MLHETVVGSGVHSSFERRLKLSEAAAEINMSLSFMEKQVSRRQIRFEKIGRSVRIPVSALTEFVQKQNGGSK